MKIRLSSFGACAALALLAAEGRAAVTMSPHAGAEVTLDGVSVAADSDFSSPVAGATADAGGAPSLFEGHSLATSAVLGPVGLVGLAASVINYDTRSDSLVRTTADADLNFSFLNDTGSLAHVFLDFSIDDFTLRAMALGSAGNAAGSELYIHAFSQLDGLSYLSDPLLFAAAAHELGASPGSNSLFGTLVSNNGTNFSCADVGGVETCGGGVGGTLDLGIVDLGQLLELNYNVNVVLTAAGSPFYSGATAIVYGNAPGLSPCVNFCTFAYLRVESLHAVPEPASWSLMIGGFAMAGAFMRRPRPAFGAIAVG